MNYQNILQLTLVLLLMACANQGLQEVTPILPSNKMQFTQIPAAQSGITFNNQLTPDVSTKANLFDFDFFYNGAGVGIADLNKDGLDDIFNLGARDVPRATAVDLHHKILVK